MFNLNDQKAVFLSPRGLFFTNPDKGNNLITGQGRFMIVGVEPVKIQNMKRENNHHFSLKLAKGWCYIRAGQLSTKMDFLP